jgi:hypothetical protein
MECDICKALNDDETPIRRATVDGCMNREGQEAFGHAWANMCDEHFRWFGLGLGIGVGQQIPRK